MTEKKRLAMVNKVFSFLVMLLFLFVGNFSFAEENGITYEEYLEIYGGYTEAEKVDQRMMELAKQNLASLLGVEKFEIGLKSIERVTWPDSALGYPEEGYYYLQVLTDGCKIILTHNGKDYEYDTDRKNTVVLDPKVKEQFK